MDLAMRAHFSCFSPARRMPAAGSRATGAGFMCKEGRTSRYGLHSEVYRASARLQFFNSSSECQSLSNGTNAVGTSVRCQRGDENLQIGSPVMIVEPPPLLKTAEPMPMMRVNKGLINSGDAGRVIGRRPKDVWAIRFAVGAFLVDRKYFKPLNME